MCESPAPTVPTTAPNTGNVVVRNDVSGTAGTDIASGINFLQQGPAGIVCDVALIQRGTCTFVSKVELAIANGASAVIMFNEGQAGRTSANFGSVGAVDIPVLSATYAVGQGLRTSPRRVRSLFMW